MPTNPPRRRRILLVDDDPEYAALVRRILRSGYEVEHASTPDRGLERVREAPVDLVLMDLEFHPERVKSAMTGVEGIRALRDHSPDIPIVVLSKTTDAIEVGRAMAAGAFYFITKHFERGLLVSLVERAISFVRMEQEVLHHRARDARSMGDLVYQCPAMQVVMERLDRYARSPAPILITGETGTGKELVAQAVHRLSGREGLYRALNVSTLPDDLFDSELFGHERGAFTNASHQRTGLLELCDKGTVFLDEIGSLSSARQATLLRVLEDGVVQRLGSNAQRAVDVRFVFATNEDLKGKRELREFRDDLWFRISHLHVGLPPLRERDADVIHIAHALLERQPGRHHQLARDASEMLLASTWPGNVRELNAVLTRACLYDDDGILDARDLEQSGFSVSSPPGEQSGKTNGGQLGEDFAVGELLPYEPARQRVERALRQKCLTQALAIANGNVSEASRRLGISRQTFYTWSSELGFVPESEDTE